MKAVIDVGSQSLRLLTFTSKEDILEGHLRSEICPLARDLQDGYLKEERKIKALEILRDYVRGLNPEEVYLYATSALREAKDGQDFIDRIREELHVHAEIISGEEEGRLGYEGVRILAGDGPFSLLDLGGGSTEIATPEWKKSFPMGVIRYQDGIDLWNYYRFLPQIQGPLYGIGGSLSVFVSLLYGSTHYQRQRIHGKIITRKDIASLTLRLEKLSLDQRRAYLGDFDKRAESIVPAGKILDFLLGQLHQDTLIYCDYTAIEAYALSRRDDR